jgi:hypothetical protein
MKKWFQQPALILLLGSLSLSACNKDDDNKEKTNTEKITLSAWKYDKAEIDSDKNGTPDAPVPSGVVEACEVDNTITFKTDNTGVVDEGATKCETSDPQSSSFTWTFKNNETIINFPTAIITNVDGDVIVKSITETSMVLSKEVEFPPLGTYTVFLTLKH